MSYLSIQAKMNTANPKLGGHRGKVIREDYTDFAGTTVSPLTKEQYEKAMRRFREGRYKVSGIMQKVPEDPEGDEWRRIKILEANIKKYISL